LVPGELAIGAIKQQNSARPDWDPIPFDSSMKTGLPLFHSKTMVLAATNIEEMTGSPGKTKVEFQPPTNYDDSWGLFKGTFYRNPRFVMK
jgi:hypothetical protein